MPNLTLQDRARAACPRTDHEHKYVFGTPCPACRTIATAITDAEKRGQDHEKRMATVCACTLTKPCSSACSCACSVMSGGCFRCATYGSLGQKKAAAEYISEKIPSED